MDWGSYVYVLTKHPPVYRKAPLRRGVLLVDADALHPIEGRGLGGEIVVVTANTPLAQSPSWICAASESEPSNE